MILFGFVSTFCGSYEFMIICLFIFVYFVRVVCFVLIFFVSLEIVFAIFVLFCFNLRLCCF